MIFGLILNLKSKHVDFSIAFIQTELETPVCLEIPRGYQSKEQRDMILELHWSLYGQVKVPKLWCSKLHCDMEDCGFRTSDLDPCLLIFKSMIVVCCIDDLLAHICKDKDF